MTRAVIAVTLLALAGYGALKAFPILRGPVIHIESPVQHQSFPDGFITISGRAAHTQSLSLNGAPFLIDESGRFSTTLLLPPGGAILSLSATDRFGRTTSQTRALYIP